MSGKVAWLIPDKPEHHLYSKIIKLLSGRYGTPAFSPHITFGSLPERPVQELSQILDPVLAGAPPVELTSDFLRCSSNPYQNLVHQLKMSPVVKKLGDEVARLLPGFRPKDEIHISLMYGRVECGEIENHHAEIEKLLPDKIRISGHKIIGLSGSIDDWSTLHYK